MRKFCLTSLLLMLVAISFTSCGSDPRAEFQVDKKYWDEKDYELALDKIRYKTPNEEKFPCYSTPEKKDIFLKLIDDNNFKVVLEDKSLGVKHRSEYAKKMFEHLSVMNEIYSGMDNQDKYIYPEELVDIETFFLEFQVLYFKIGNENILKEADNPNDAETQRIIKSNEQVAVSNFNLYLDKVNKESAFSPTAITKYCSGIDTWFKKLTETFPTANYADMVEKAGLMEKKAQSSEIKASLKKLLDLLDNLTPKPNTATDSTVVK